MLFLLFVHSYYFDQIAKFSLFFIAQFNKSEIQIHDTKLLQCNALPQANKVFFFVILLHGSQDAQVHLSE